MMSYEPHIGTDGAGEDGDGVRGWGSQFQVPMTCRNREEPCEM